MGEEEETSHPPGAQLHIHNVVNNRQAVAMLCSPKVFPPCLCTLCGTVKPVTSLSFCCLSGWLGSAAMTDNHSFSNGMLNVGCSKS